VEGGLHRLNACVL